MLAETEDFDVLHDHHFVIRHREQRSVQNLVKIGAITGGHIVQGARKAMGSLHQPFPLGILSDPEQQFTQQFFGGSRGKLIRLHHIHI